MKDKKDLAKYFPITMSEVQRKETKEAKSDSQSFSKRTAPLNNEDQMISMFKKRMENLALAKASEERQNLRLETKEEILSEIKSGSPESPKKGLASKVFLPFELLLQEFA